MNPPVAKKFFLFGYPIAHSAAPTLHNHCFTAWSSGGSRNTYELWSTSRVTQEVIDVLRSDEFGGAAVTMPLKNDILEYLDEVSLESQATGACNTIIKVPQLGGGHKLVGQNTDILGVRNALLNALRTQHPTIPFTLSALSSFPSTSNAAGLIVGGGATTRSAAYALSLLGLTPIFLINRDDQEIRDVQASFKHLELIHLKDPEGVEYYLVGEGKPRIVMGVGAIPAIAPVTRAERMVYTTASAVFTIPETNFHRPPDFKGSDDGSSFVLPLPSRRIFLEMAYKPRQTTMIQVAAAHGWHVVGGIQAMIEQGLAQQRMWYTSTPTIQIGSDPRVLDSHIDAEVHRLCGEMPDIVVAAVEADRASTE